MSARRPSLPFVPAALADLSDLAVSELEAHFSDSAFRRGETYARTGRVQELSWDEEHTALSASVIGNGAVYTTVAYFVDADDGRALIDGECSCPVGYNCKHVVAVILAAREQSVGVGAVDPEPSTAPTPYPAEPAVPDPAEPVTRASPPARRPAAWERTLRPLVAARAAYSAGAPLAIELKLTASRYAEGGAALMGRLMRPGARGGWVNGSLDWGGIEWQVRNGEYRGDHVEIVRELFALHQSGRAHYSYGYGSERTVDISACDSPQLWVLLEEARRVGLPLIHAQARFGEIPPILTGELVLDVSRPAGPDGPFTVRLVTQVTELPAESLVPVRFIGRSGHGMIWARRAEAEAHADPSRWPLWLIRLARSTPPELTRMFETREPLEIPASEIERFAAELAPGLRHVAPVVSSDDSFTPPEVSAPALVLRVEHRPGPIMTLGWEWEYEIGGTRRRIPLGASGDEGVRDFDAEREHILAIALDEPALRSIDLLDDGGRPPVRERHSSVSTA